jgi:hypothetical protein
MRDQLPPDIPCPVEPKPPREAEDEELELVDDVREPPVEKLELVDEEPEGDEGDETRPTRPPELGGVSAVESADTRLLVRWLRESVRQLQSPQWLREPLLLQARRRHGSP